MNHRDYEFFTDLPESTKEEVLNPSSNLIGQAFRGIAHFVLDPLVRYNIVKDAEMEDFANKTRSKTDQIPEENRDDSQIGLAYKAVEDSAYQLNSETLREMFSNLVAATVDNRMNNQVKPSFSTILKDLSPDEASLFELIYRRTALASVTIRFENKETQEGIDLKSNIILSDKIIEKPIPLKLLEKFGLIEVRSDYYLVAKEFIKRYEGFEKSSFYQKIKDENNKPISKYGLTIDTLKVKKGSVHISPLGKQFGKVVISD